MITREDIDRILGISESYELPEKLLTLMLNTAERRRIFEEFTILENDLSFDWFTDYFQESHSNREKMMQDFTPVELAHLLPEMAGKYSRVLDVCAGTGGLTIAAWAKNPDAVFFCEELSTRAIPLLLFNLAVRNMNAYVLHEDVLEQEIKAIYQIEPSDRFANIHVLGDVPEFVPDLVITNPPYSLKWKPENEAQDERFEGYGYPPTNAADYGFVLHGLHKLQDGGELLAILPHGVLFRGRQEETIRKALIEKNVLDAVIGLPEKLFLNTNIPVCVIGLKKDRQENGDVLVIDASADYEARGKRNLLHKRSVMRIVSCLRSRNEVERYSHRASVKEIADNSFNLNIPRYVDTYVPEELPDVFQLMHELAELDQQISVATMALLNNLKELRTNNEETQRELACVINTFETVKENHNGQIESLCL